MDEALMAMLRVAAVDPSAPFASGQGPWEVWLMLRARWGRRATLVELYALDAAYLGISAEELGTAGSRACPA